MSEKPNSKYCCWCGKYYKYLMPSNRFGEVVCPKCDEDDDFVEHVCRLERLERFKARTTKGEAFA